VNEAYLKLFGNGIANATEGGCATFENRRHFFAAAARAMHQIRLDDARKRRRLKRGGGLAVARTDEDPAVFDHDQVDVLALDEALAKLSDERPELVELVRLRFFVGLSLDESADVLGVSRRTVANRWRLARAWLYGALDGPTGVRRVSESDDGDGSLGPD
jgi:RNA polymerase sigma factor (TIGR02999 family)